jgi:hypothetical protein
MVMSHREIEQLSGTGTVRKSDGSVLGAREYELVVLQRMLPDGRGGEIPGVKHIDGHIRLLGDEALSLVVNREKLTLVVQDGRSVEFFVSSSSGKITFSGPLERKEG